MIAHHFLGSAWREMLERQQLEKSQAPSLDGHTDEAEVGGGCTLLFSFLF